jgi:Transglycosylase SLT domain
MKWFYPLLLLLLLPTDSKADVPSTLAERCVQHYATHYRVPPELIAALIDVESRWNPHALSNKGAMGLMQLMPDTARRYGALQPFDVEQNIAAAILEAEADVWVVRANAYTQAALAELMRTRGIDLANQSKVAKLATTDNTGNNNLINGSLTNR